MRIVDTHTHLNSSPLLEDKENIIKVAKDCGVERFIVIGYNVETSQKALEIATFHEGECFAVVGIHPSEITENIENDLIKIEKMLNDKHVVGVGEIGLDYHYDGYDKDKQIKYFEKQIILANKHKKPIVIHSRDAAKDTLDVLSKNKDYINNSGIMHCYAYSKEMVLDFSKLDLYFAFGGSLTFKNSKVNKEAITAVPLDKLLFETDSPYLTPHPYRGQVNEPKYITLVLDEASRILNIEKEKLAEIEFANACKLFKLR